MTGHRRRIFGKISDDVWDTNVRRIEDVIFVMIGLGLGIALIGGGITGSWALFKFVLLP